MLRGRSAGAIEFKHANISAVLIELGFPYIDGYKPRANYQELLRDEVVARLDHERALHDVAAALVEAHMHTPPPELSLSDVMVPAPTRERGRTYERRVPPPVPSTSINYLEREAANASLGGAGERFVLDIECRRLREAGRRALAERIEHVARTQGDGLGYDILSFETDGRERLIEVKTTAFGAMTPFFASRREVAVSEERAAEYSLYRVFTFRKAPKLFLLPGSLKESCVLDAVQYRASLP
jgi:hypothetical protein